VADSNCAYRAVSLTLYGTQELHQYIEILTHQQVYDASSPSFAIADTRIMTSDYKTIVEHAITDGRYVESGTDIQLQLQAITVRQITITITK